MTRKSRRFAGGWPESGPPVLLFAGEPGIGKTRLLDEAADRAAQTAWRVVRGGCQRRAADLYAPLSGARGRCPAEPVGPATART